MTYTEQFNQVEKSLKVLSNTQYDHKAFNLNYVFGSLLHEKFKGTLNWSFTRQPEGGEFHKGVYYTVVGKSTRTGPNSSKDNKEDSDLVTVLLHWGLKPEFLDDMTSWRPEYKITDVPFSVVHLLKEEEETNYGLLADAVRNYKSTGKWVIDYGPEEGE